MCFENVLYTLSMTFLCYYHVIILLLHHLTNPVNILAIWIDVGYESA